VKLLDGGRVTLADGSTESIRNAGVMVVTSYNAQVRMLRGMLPGSRYRTVEQMRLVNALCRFVELATPEADVEAAVTAAA
jgi:hypothetical protein